MPIISPFHCSHVPAHTYTQNLTVFLGCIKVNGKLHLFLKPLSHSVFLREAELNEGDGIKIRKAIVDMYLNLKPPSVNSDVQFKFE